MNTSQQRQENKKTVKKNIYIYEKQVKDLAVIVYLSVVF